MQAKRTFIGSRSVILAAFGIIFLTLKAVTARHSPPARPCPDGAAQELLTPSAYADVPCKAALEFCASNAECCSGTCGPCGVCASGCGDCICDPGDGGDWCDCMDCGVCPSAPIGVTGGGGVGAGGVGSF